jgi:hypothetical protein
MLEALLDAVLQLNPAIQSYVRFALAPDVLRVLHAEVRSLPSTEQASVLGWNHIYGLAYRVDVTLPRGRAHLEYRTGHELRLRLPAIEDPFSYHHRRAA